MLANILDMIHLAIILKTVYKIFGEIANSG